MKTSDLQVLLYNVKMSSSVKSSSGGWSKWSLDARGVHALASDDFVAVRCTQQGGMAMSDDGVAEETWYWDLGHLKEVSAYLDDQDEAEEVELSTMSLTEREPSQDVKDQLDFVEQVVTGDTVESSHTPEGFILWPDRLRKLNLIKPQGNPVAFRWDNYNGVFQFKLGPSVRGALSDLDPDALDEDVKW